MVTKHAAIRMKQRGIPPVIIDWLQQFGAEEFDLLLESRLTRGDTELAAPRMTVLRGHIARIQLGDTNSGVIEVTLSPLAP